MSKKTIIDEMCTCGHLKSQHNPTKLKVLAEIEGHGKCTVCDCKKFTWKSFVYINE